MPKYPGIKVQLTGKNGNAFAILAAVTKALSRGGVEKSERNKFIAEATSGDYNHLLVTAMNWVDVS